jgi:16S rRNA (adenine(1408)-N(1))-methyltransferase
VIGVDASAAGMAEASLRAARSERKGGLANALFVVAAAERPPAELRAIAAETTIHLPWGSLLRGALALDDACDAARGITGLVAPGGVVRALISIDPRDRLTAPPLESAARDALAARWRRHGLSLTGLGPATTTDIDETGSSWARRLAAGRDRLVWRLELRKATGEGESVAEDV